MLLGFELILSINWLVGTIISEKLFGQTVYRQKQREEMSPEQIHGLHQACKVVGALTYAVDIVLYLWNACLVRKDDYMGGGGI